jgi:small subunit ribosomal protein S1
MSEKETTKAEVETTEAAVTTTETTTVETPKVEEVNPEQFLADFNWHNYEEGIDPVDEKQLEEFEKLVSENFVDTLDDEVVEGTVSFIRSRCYY